MAKAKSKATKARRARPRRKPKRRVVLRGWDGVTQKHYDVTQSEGGPTEENLPERISHDIPADWLPRMREATKRSEELVEGKRLHPVDRVIAIDGGLLQPRAQNKRQSKRKRGRQQKHNIEGNIFDAADAVKKRPRRYRLQSDFIRAVLDELTARGIKRPGDTWMKKHVGPMHKRPRQAPKTGR
jgi:hypothetical protein